MTKKILVHYDFSQNEIQNAKAQNLAADPSTPSAGQFWYNTTTGKMMWRGNAANIDPTSRANHTGTQTASTISDFSASVQAIRLDQHAAPTAAVAMNSQKITGLADPTAAQDAATKNYVDNAVSGLDWKQSVRAATTANITLSGGQSIDAVPLNFLDRVLVKNQTNPAENGIYICNNSGAWTRSSDADTSAKINANLTTMVEEGNTNAGTQWRMTTVGTPILGTSALSFVQIGATTSYTNGSGISITGNAIAIDPSVVVRKFSATVGGNLSIPVAHGLNTTDVQVQVYSIATGELVECDVVRTNATTVTLGFAVAPTANSIRVTILG